MQKPFVVGKTAEEPEASVGGSFDAVIIALDIAAAPPAGLNALGSPGLCDAVPAALPMKLKWRAAGDDGEDFEGNRFGFEAERTRKDVSG